mmetsp:Transcript_31974/g.88066  ORF Transcript_31974/g.88066 Transcript_31974/m.88066 type:complete len:442 (-) Transcript_31974:653-1978(-)
MLSVSASIESFSVVAPSAEGSSPAQSPCGPLMEPVGMSATRKATGLGGGRRGSPPLPSRRGLPGSHLLGLGGTTGRETELSSASGGRGTGVRGGPADRGATGGMRGGGLRLGFAPLGTTSRGLGGGIASESARLAALWRGAFAGGSSPAASMAFPLDGPSVEAVGAGSLGRSAECSALLLRSLPAPPRLLCRRDRPKPAATKPAFPPTVSMKEAAPAARGRLAERCSALSALERAPGPNGHLRTVEVITGPPETGAGAIAGTDPRGCGKAPPSEAASGCATGSAPRPSGGPASCAALRSAAPRQYPASSSGPSARTPGRSQPSILRERCKSSRSTWQSSGHLSRRYATGESGRGRSQYSTGTACSANCLIASTVCGRGKPESSRRHPGRAWGLRVALAASACAVPGAGADDADAGTEGSSTGPGSDDDADPRAVDPVLLLG